VSSEKTHLDTDARGMRHASRSGTRGGVKPADNVPTSLSRTKTRATPAVYADERNLCVKRRKLEQVKWLIHLAQKGKVSVPRCSQISEGYLTRTPGVKQAS